MKIPSALLVAAATLVLSACGSAKSETAKKPAKAEVIGHEAELLKLTLTPQAVARLGIATVRVGDGENANSLSLPGEVVMPPAGGGVPISSASDLTLLASNQARAEGEIMRAQAELGIAQKNAARAAALVREEAGSIKARDEAQAAVAVARSSLHVAQRQRALYGTPVAAMGRMGNAWVRVPVPSGELAQVEQGAPAQVGLLGEANGRISARPVNGPPSANAAAGTVDLYYVLGRPGANFRFGQRVMIDLPAKGRSRGLTVPESAILRDIYGGEWVYVMTDKTAFERRRIEVASLQGGQAVLARGLDAGVQVVTAGATELFGTEFGTK